MALATLWHLRVKSHIHTLRGSAGGPEKGQKGVTWEGQEGSPICIAHRTARRAGLGGKSTMQNSG